MTVAEDAQPQQPPSMPLERDSLFDPPPALAAFPPISPLRLPSGARGWAVTGHAEARAILADRRFSADRSRAELALPQLNERFRQRGSRPGLFISMDDPEHARYRKMLTAQFTVPRMRELEPRVEQIVDEALDRLAAAGQPADLVTEFALPVPSLVICELLGVDYADRAEFQGMSKKLLSLNTSPEEVYADLEHLMRFMHDLVLAKRTAPTDDILSGLVTDTDLTDEELVNMAFLLLIAGHETTANMLGLGTFALLLNPAETRKLQQDPGLMPGAVEELLRYLTIVAAQGGLPRVALEDLTIGDARIRAGETVLISLPAANRDPVLAENPDQLDVSRPRTHHVAFGHGIHQCLGQQLARVEMRIGFARLLERFPTLRLAVPAEEVPMRTDMTIYGVHALPVAW